MRATPPASSGRAGLTATTSVSIRQDLPMRGCSARRIARDIQSSAIQWIKFRNIDARPPNQAALRGHVRAIRVPARARPAPASLCDGNCASRRERTRLRTKQGAIDDHGGCAARCGEKQCRKPLAFAQTGLHFFVSCVPEKAPAKWQTWGPAMGIKTRRGSEAVRIGRRVGICVQNP